MLVWLTGCRPSCPEVIAIDVSGLESVESSQELAPTGRPRNASVANLVVGLPWPALPRYQNVFYEGNNPLLRSRDAAGRRPTGIAVARRWRRSAARARRVFALRDSLFSQQDHPLGPEPWAPLFPPAWIAVGVDAVLRGATPRLPEIPEPQADGRWRRLGVREAFGDFPVSPTLHRWATTSLCGVDAVERRTVLAARTTSLALARAVRSMWRVAPEGPEAVARAGARSVSAGDVRYFGESLRRDRVVPMLVENPSPKEVREGKGLRPRSHPSLSEEAVRITLRAVLQARLRDGDTAVERYDLTRDDERSRALQLVRDVLEGERSGDGRLWLWLSGPTAPEGDPAPGVPSGIAAFRRGVEASGVDPSRLGLLYMPRLRSIEAAAAGPSELARAAGPMPVVQRSRQSEAHLRPLDSVAARRPGTAEAPVRADREAAGPDPLGAADRSRPGAG